MAKKLGIVTWDADSAALYAHQISEFFGDEIEIQTYSVQAGTIDLLEEADVYLVSTCAFMERDLTKILPQSKMVISEVYITKESLNKLKAVQRNTQALLVNINQPMSIETIALINQLGVTNIQFIPYYPGAPEPPRVHLAVTAGEKRYVPDWVEEVIDLGPRLLSGNTFVELAYHFKCEYYLNEPKFQAYLSRLAKNPYGIERMFHRTIQVANLFDLFQKTMDTGVIGVDPDGTIFACNDKAGEILGIPVHQLQEKHYHEALDMLPIEESLRGRKFIQSRIVEIRSTPVNVSVHPLFRGDGLMGAYCTLQVFNDHEKRQQTIRRQVMGKGHTTKYTFDSIIGQSPAIQTSKALAKRMAASNAAILISGESGTGKELFAHAIHASSTRKREPFVAINCAAIPDNLLESQLFGYEEGSFTGAKKGGHKGFFEVAHNGTLFLDEIEAMSPMLQVKLLRVLQEKEIVRLGGVDVIPVDVRIIAATNEDLAAIVKKGDFRKDLYYRLSVLPLRLPPLRERVEDVLLLLEELQKGIDCDFTLSPAAIQVLRAHRWEGNVRELRNCVEYLAYLDKRMIQPEDLPPTIIPPEETIFTAVSEREETGVGDVTAHTLAQLERRAGSDLAAYVFILTTLQENSMGRKGLSDAAHTKGIPLSEQTARTALLHLEELGLVEVRRGRGGSRTTSLGRAIAQQLEKKLHM